MADGRSKNGGARANAGRPPRVVEEDTLKRIKRALGQKTNELGQPTDDTCLDQIIDKWLKDCLSSSATVRLRARGQLFEYILRKPAQRVDMGNENGKPVEHVHMTLDEWRKEREARNAQAAEALANLPEAHA